MTTFSSARKPVIDRQRRIASLIRERGGVSASELTDLFGVTDETIRRDLAHLASVGVIRRLHGGAVAEHTREESGFDRRSREHLREKVAIARAAAAGITDGSTIIVDSGTTTVQLAKELNGKRDLVVVTNAVTNAVELMNNPDITVVLTGGVIRPRTFGAVGEMAVANLNELRVDQAYLAISGISIDGGLTYPSFEEAAVKRAMMAVASEVILLADSSKFGRDSMVRVGPLDAVTRIITDPGIDRQTADHVRDLGVDLIIADLDAAASDETRADDRAADVAGPRARSAGHPRARKSVRDPSASVSP